MTTAGKGAAVKRSLPYRALIVYQISDILATPKPTESDKTAIFCNKSMTKGMIKMVTRDEEEEILDALTVLDPDDYDTWLTVGMILKYEGVDFVFWDNWSANSPKYKPYETSKKWQSFRRDSGNVKTKLSLFKMAREAGWRPKKNDSDDWRKKYDHPIDWNDPINDDWMPPKG